MAPGTFYDLIREFVEHEFVPGLSHLFLGGRLLKYLKVQIEQWPYTTTFGFFYDVFRVMKLMFCLVKGRYILAQILNEFSVKFNQTVPPPADPPDDPNAAPRALQFHFFSNFMKCGLIHGIVKHKNSLKEILSYPVFSPFFEHFMVGCSINCRNCLSRVESYLTSRDAFENGDAAKIVQLQNDLISVFDGGHVITETEKMAYLFSELRMVDI
uniref:Uncharacterized protein n=1 Tax=Panagrolaimus davidi TaxID=227884 RepID=A0A914QUI8_9BILA